MDVLVWGRSSGSFRCYERCGLDAVGDGRNAVMMIAWGVLMMFAFKSRTAEGHYDGSHKQLQVGRPDSRNLAVSLTDTTNFLCLTDKEPSVDGR